MPIDRYRRANQSNWDSRVAIHTASEEYGLHRYQDPDHLSGVVEFDRDRVPSVAGKRLLHLQCHIGTDTLSWARLGAEVTGIDISPKSIEAAKRLSAESGTPGRFVLTELYDAPQVLTERFDMVYTGVGAINWLPDIGAWGEVVSSFLVPGGLFYMREGHPILWTLDDERDDDDLIARFPYFETREPSMFSEQSSYAGDGVVDSPVTYEWNHGVAETLQALIDAGLRIERVEEYDFLEWQFGPVNQLGGDGRWRLADRRERLPLMWSVLATKSD